MSIHIVLEPAGGASITAHAHCQNHRTQRCCAVGFRKHTRTKIHLAIHDQINQRLRQMPSRCQENLLDRRLIGWYNCSRVDKN